MNGDGRTALVVPIFLRVDHLDFMDLADDKVETIIDVKFDEESKIEIRIGLSRKGKP